MRWADLDLLGHVNNVVYVDYLQEARVDLMRSQVSGARSAGLAEGIVVVRHEVGYRAPLLLDQGTVDIECWVTEVRPASFTMAYEVFHADAADDTDDGLRVYLRAKTLLTPYVFATERPRRITSDERAGLELFLEPDARVRPRPAPEIRRTEIGHWPVHVRFSDVDAYGHVNNVKYFEYFQEGRISYVSRLWSGPSPHVTGMVVAQVDVDYRVPLVFRAEPYDLWSQISRVGSRSITLEAAVCDGDTVCAAATVVLVFWDPATGRSVEPDPEVRALAEAQLRPVG